MTHAPLGHLDTLNRVICKVWGHWPALVVEPCRCRRCGRMIRWNDKGGWRLTRQIEWYPHRLTRAAREAIEAIRTPPGTMGHSDGLTDEMGG